jgi:hypothetical protein
LDLGRERFNQFDAGHRQYLGNDDHAEFESARLEPVVAIYAGPPHTQPNLANPARASLDFGPFT